MPTSFRTACITLNNPTKQLEPDRIDGLSYLVWQLERGAEGLHLPQLHPML